MAIPSTTFTIEETQAAPLHHSDEIVYVVGKVGIDGNGLPGQVYGPFETTDDVSLLVGSDGYLHDFLDDLLTRVEVEVFISFYTDMKDDGTGTLEDKTAAEIEEDIIEALNLYAQATDSPTV